LFLINFLNETFSSIVSNLALINALKSLSLAQPGIKPHLSASNVFPFLYFLITGSF
jgi:hypothetical protein